MTEIHGAVFVGVGLLVAAISFSLKIYLFILVGLALVVWGAVKISQQEKKKPTHMQHPHCPFCNNRVQNHDNFCSHCGAYLKHQRGHPNLQKGSYHQHYNRYNHQIRRVP